MRDTDIFEKALALPAPWKVTACSFSAEVRRLDLAVDFPAGSQFLCPTCGKSCPVHDTTQKTYRHLDFFEHKAYITARVPRVSCGQHGVLQIEVPWSRPGSGFSFVFEGHILFLAPAMAMKHVAQFVGENDTLLWRMVHHHVKDGRSRADHSTVRRMAFDETAGRRGHDYVTVSVDLDEKRVLFAVPGKGKGKACIKAAADDLRKHGGNPKAITTVACDIFAAFTAGIEKYLPKAMLTYD